MAKKIKASSLKTFGTKEQDEFMRKVFTAHQKRAEKQRVYVADLAVLDLETVEGKHKLEKKAAADAKSMLAAARAALKAAQNNKDKDAEATSSIGVQSGYRAATEQRGIWRGKFPDFYKATAAARAKLKDGEHGDKAVTLVVDYYTKRIASPGYSNHQPGKAIDLNSEIKDDKGKKVKLAASKSQNKLWRKSWFYTWLSDNAKSYNFKENKAIDEAWHWEYTK